MRRTAVFFLWLFGILSAVQCAMGSPNLNEVGSFRLLVPNYSKSSGGVCPVLSPDGKYLAYFTENSRPVWIVHGDDLLNPKDISSIQSWKLEFDSPGDFPYEVGLYLQGCPDADWSADGTQLAFIGIDNRLYVVNKAELTGKTVHPRIVATPVTLPGDKAAGRILSPRWSPDGKKIAFMRSKPGNLTWASIAVIELSSGKEAIVADNAAYWQHPWSPDGTMLAYKSAKPEGISIVTVDGKDHRLITKGPEIGCPGWIPNTDRIYYAVNRATKVKSADFEMTWILMSVRSVDFHGDHLQSVYEMPMLTPAEIALKKDRISQGSVLSFKREFGSRLTAEQSELLRSGKLTAEQMQDIALLCAAKEIGGDFLTKMQDIVRESESQQNVDLPKLVWSLPQDKRNEFMGRLLSALFPGTGMGHQPLLNTLALSPDGRRIAFVVDTMGEQLLSVCDIGGTDQARTLFESSSIESLCWSSDGKCLAVESRRIEAKSDDSSQTGYPEIWLLQVR